MKVPVLIALARAADRGQLRLDQAMPLVNQFASIVDGSAYTLDKTADSDDSVYARVGEPVPIRWLATRMITHSSNLATNAMLTVGARRLGHGSHAHPRHHPPCWCAAASRTPRPSAPA